MIILSEEAEPIVIRSTQKYFDFFKVDFPLFEYIETTNGEVTKENALNLEGIINKAIDLNKPVLIPDDYNERCY